MKTLGERWISTRGGTIGIALTENEFRQKAFICVVPGVNMVDDLIMVINYGGSLSKTEAIGFFGKLVNKKTYKV